MSKQVMDIGCPEARRMISRLVDGEAAVGPEPERHMAACADCRAEYEELRRSRQTLVDAGTPEAPPFLLTRVMAEARRVRPGPRYGLVPALRAVAVVLVVAAGLGAGAFIGTQLAGSGAAESATENGIGATEVTTVDVYASALGGGE